MPFVNEYVSVEDVRSYRLDEIWRRYHGRESQPPGFKYAWTVDKQRAIFLMRVRTVREALSYKITFVLYWSGVVIEAELGRRGSGSLKEPVISVWRLISYRYPGLGRTRDEVLRLLKEALIAFKVSGVRRPVADHIAVFEF